MPQEVKNYLINAGIPENIADHCGKIAATIGTKTDKASDKLETNQIMFFSDGEMKEIAEILKKMATGKTLEQVKGIKPKEVEKNMKSNGNNITPDIALFGRMVTSDLFRDIEASLQCAHAISTNKMDQEFDYFTAIDDLSDKEKGMEEQGAAMLGDIEFTSACYYKYFSINTNGFIDNMMTTLEGSDAAAQAKAILIDVISGFLKGAIFVTPSGKQNTFAAHQLPDLILIEIKDQKIPVSYANAFIKPVTPKGNKDLMDCSIDALKTYVETTFKTFNLESKYRLLLNTKGVEIEGFEKVDDVNGLVAKLEEYLNAEL